ncbi:MAG TPA: ABC transporter permease [Parafilimonas sp.]|nr:ABC transporter permease [Parafilimonas sp.]
MFKNYFKTAWRNFQQQKTFSFINISGLSIGIACFCLLTLYAYNELSFDRFNQNAKNIYRPYVWFTAMGMGNGNPSEGYMDYSGPTSTTLGEAMKKSLPDVVNYVRIQLPYDESLIRIGNKGLRSDITYADPSLFSVFSFPLKYGNVNTLFRHLNEVVLTESKAKEIFGGDNVIGKMLEIKIDSSFQPFVVSAIAKDIPSNSTIHFDILGNYLYAAKYVNGSNFSWSNFHYLDKQTFVQLKPGSKLADDSKRLQNFLASFNPGYLEGINAGATKQGNEPPVSLRLQPLTAIHTSTVNLWHDFPHLNLKTIWILMSIAFGILLIACINFTTLAAGRSARRSKEVGVRKVMGAAKKHLISQFISEAYFFVIISTALGLLLAAFLLPYFNTLAGSHLHLSFSILPQAVILIVAILFLVGLLAGSYPAFVLSGLKPLEVFKDKLRIGGVSAFTKSLVTFQFALSIVLIVSTILIFNQTKYMISKNPGFNKENVVVIDASEADPAKIFPLFKQAITQDPSVENVASAAAGIGAGKSYLGYSDQGLSADINIIDTSYITVLGMKLVAGNNFSEAQMNDSVKSVIINESMMKALGWTTQNAIGKTIKNFQGKNAIVTGVVKNFSYQPLSEKIKNQAFVTSKESGYTNFYVRIKPGDQLPVLADMQKQWNILLPGIPMKFSFLDEDLHNYYESEERWSGIIAWASVISIFLGCLGLLGLTSLAAINRTKEIGIRKVLGSSSGGIALLLSKDIVKPVVLAMLIAFPVAWWAMHNWLHSFAYRINISWWVFIVAGVSALLIALITISFQAIKAAIANPVKSLRTE